MRLFIFFAVSGMLAGEASAFRLTPMRYVLEPSGPEAEITLRLENTFSIDLPVEIEVYKRTINEEGVEERTSGESDFLVFPPQSLIPVGAEQAFRVRYVGPPGIEDMVSYVIVVRQLPIRNRDAESSGVDVMLALGTAAYVAPNGTKADLSVTIEPDNEDPARAILWVANEGSAYGYVDRFDVSLSADDGTNVIIPASEIGPTLETPLVMPHSKRKVYLTVPETLRGRALAGAEIAPSAEQ
ncbi:MAG: hypothetical protein RLO80_07345 [Hyphomonas sp.]